MSLEIIIFIVVVVTLGFGLAALTLMLNNAKQKLAEKAAAPLVPVVTGPTVAELEQKLKAAYEAEINKSTTIFAADLMATSAKLSEQVSRLTTQVIEEELAAYQSTLEELRKVAGGTMDQLRTNIETQKAELTASMNTDITAERARQIEKFQLRMGDIVAGYITESLGGGIDLGSQMSYIVKSLEAHKDDIKKDLTNGV